MNKKQVKEEIAHMHKLFGNCKLERPGYNWGNMDFTKHKSRTESKLNNFRSKCINKQRKR